MATSRKASLALIRVGRYVAKRLRIEDNAAVLAIHRRVLGVFRGGSPVETISIDGRDVMVPSDMSMLPGLLNGTYERREREFVLRTLRPGATFIDVGANFGLYAMLASRIVGPSGKVYAFEPVPSTFALLERNTEGLDNVECIQAACGRETGDLTIYADPASPGCSSALVPSGVATTVPVVTLDAFLSERGDPAVDLVKIDVEGFEEEVLDGARGLVSRGTTFLCEFNATFLVSIGRDPQALLDSLLATFGSIAYIDERTGEARPVRRTEDLRGQIVANLVLRS